MGVTPPLGNIEKLGDMKPDTVGAADASGPRNSAAKAANGDEYVPVPRPATVEQLADAINMWGLYLKLWGERVDTAFHEMSAKIDEVNAAVQGPSHLDPPPEPFVPGPT